MTAKLNYAWHLREVMAAAGMFSTTDLRPLLAERGIDLSASQTYRLVTERPERLSLKTLVALMDILGCSMEALVEPIPVARAARKSAAAGGTRETGGPASPGVGALRPRRARVVPE